LAVVPTYPARSKAFAMHFVRELIFAGVPGELGADVFTLLVVIASMEDEVRYTRAPNYFNSQLVERCGFESERKLIRVRAKAVEAVWLHYEQGRKRSPGRYWVLSRDPLSLTHGTGKAQGNEGDEVVSLTHSLTPGAGKAQGKCQPSIPMPSPKPKDTPAQVGQKEKLHLRDELFDAVAEVTGTDPMVSRSHIGRVCHLLVKANPPYTAAEVRAFGARYAELCPWSVDKNIPLTLGVIEKHIGQLRTAKPAAKPRAGWGWKRPSNDPLPEVLK